MFVVPFENGSYFSVDVFLSDALYKMVFAWNSAFSFWYMDVLDSSENVLIAGIKICPMQELLSRYANRGLPGGKLYSLNVDGTYRDISFDDFYTGKSILVFIEE